MKVNLLICAMRQHAASVNKQLFDDVSVYNSEKICGIDFAGPEVGFPPYEIQNTIQYGLEKGMNLTL
ncbi:adenosine deaminase, partial [Bacillus amyloliquefaciens]